MNIGKFQVNKTARYAVLEPEGEARALLYALHGYRQLVTYFISPFEILAKKGVCVVAPEGLHRFYTEGYSGQVGASWMTKEDREDDIRDYVNYLNALHAHLTPQFRGLPVHLLGFSQGGATASRWLGQSDIAFHSFTLYASVFPNDFDFPGMAGRIAEMDTYICFGDNDRFADEKTIGRKMEWLRSNGYEPKLLRFKGLHKVYPEVLEQLWMEISAD